MGITIHYAGRAASEADIDAIIETSIGRARSLGWTGRVPAPEDIRAEGLVFLPHENSEPLTLHFSRTRRFSDFCKTQFAGPVVHRQVLEFLEHCLWPHCSKQILIDEAQDHYTEDDQPASLEEVFRASLEYIREGQKEYPGSEMQVRLPSGRIADLVG